MSADMIEVGGVMRPATYEKAVELAAAQIAPIEAAREKVRDAASDLVDVCIRQYPVGSRVGVNIAARQSPTHEVMEVNQYGVLTLKNVYTCTIRKLKADSWMISPCTSWYTREERKTK